MRFLRAGLCFVSTTADFGTLNSACMVRVKFRLAAGPSSQVLSLFISTPAVERFLAVHQLFPMFYKGYISWVDLAGGDSQKLDFWRRYWTASVTPAWLDAVPMMSATGTAAPAGVPSGTRAFTCSTPATSPGAAPAYNTSAVTPPMVTETGSRGWGRVVPAI
jgi:hypothetical protein